MGFSEPILSYFSAARFVFDGARILKEGYEKVLWLFQYAFSRIELMILLLSDKTGSIQNCHFPQVDGVGDRTSADRRCQEGSR